MVEARSAIVRPPESYRLRVRLDLRSQCRLAGLADCNGSNGRKETSYETPPTLAMTAAPKLAYPSSVPGASDTPSCSRTLHLASTADLPASPLP